MATIGQSLTTPDSGWKRYDDFLPQFKYIGTFTAYSSNANFYNNTYHYSDVINDKISFKVYGTKLRIIDSKDTNRSKNISIRVDGVEYGVLNQYSTTVTYQTLDYEITGLTEGLHLIEMVNIGAGRMIIDAIDIDSTGRLLHIDEVLDIADLEVGKRIRCHYTASTSGQVGTLSNLGQETYKDGINDFIPLASSATPNGDFYYLCVGKDYLDRWKLIPDRNIQHSISFDVLNTSGIASGSGLLNKMSNSFKINGYHMTNFSDISKLFNGQSSNYDGANGNIGYFRYNIDYIDITLDDVATLFALPAMNYLNNTSTMLSDLKIDKWDGTTFVNIGKTNPFVLNNTEWHDWTGELQAGRYKIYNYTDAASNMVSELYIGKKLEQNYNFTTRLLTGGTSSADKDSEWDQYIVNSSLNNTISMGDNNTWHWSGIASWTSTTPSGTSANRVIRGNTANSTYSSLATSTANTTTGFRPVLLIESLFTPYQKLLILSNGEYKKFNGTTWDTVSTSVTEQDYINNGMDSISSITYEQWKLLNDTLPKISYYTNVSETSSAKVQESLSYPTVGTRLIKR